MKSKALRNGRHEDIAYGEWSKVFLFCLMAAVAISLVALTCVPGVSRALAAGKILELCAVTLWAASSLVSVMMFVWYLKRRNPAYYLADLPCTSNDRIWVVWMLFMAWPVLLASGIGMLGKLTEVRRKLS